MSERRLLAAVGGFAFVAAWIGFSFGGALLCALGAAVCWVVAAILEGKVDLGELQSRLSGEGEPPAAAKAPTPPPAPRARPRVQ